MPIRSGAMQRPRGSRCGNTLRHRYDEVGLPCSKTMGSPSPTSTYAISLPRIRRRCFWYGNAAEIPSSFWLAGAGFFGPGLLPPRSGRSDSGMAPPVCPCATAAAVSTPPHVIAASMLRREIESDLEFMTDSPGADVIAGFVIATAISDHLGLSQ